MEPEVSYAAGQRVAVACSESNLPDNVPMRKKIDPVIYYLKFIAKNIQKKKIVLKNCLYYHKHNRKNVKTNNKNT